MVQGLTLKNVKSYTNNGLDGWKQFRNTPINHHGYQAREGPLQLYAIFDGEALKFGVAKDPEWRLSQFQTGNSRELLLLGSTLADRKLEREVHRYCKDQRIRRSEWFVREGRAIEIEVLIVRGDHRPIFGLMGREVPEKLK